MMVEKQKIKKPNPKFCGKGTSLFKIYLKRMPPKKLPKLPKAKESPKNVPRTLRRVTELRKSTQTGMTIPRPNP